MPKHLRADFYILFKSRTMWVAWILCALALLFSPVVRFLFSTSGSDNYVLFLIRDSVHHYAALLLICVFLAKECDSRASKNLTGKGVCSKLQYVCSKAAVILVVIVAFYLVELLLYTVLGLVFFYKDYGWGFFVGIEIPDENGYFSGNFYRNSVTTSDLLRTQALGLMFIVAMAMVVLMLFFLIRNGIAVTAIVVPYTFFHAEVYKALGKLFHFNYSKLDYLTVFGNFTTRFGDGIEWAQTTVPRQLVFGAIAIAFYFALSCLFACIGERR